MDAVWKDSSREGLIFGVVIIFFILIGLTVTLSDIVGNSLDLDSDSMIGNTRGLMVTYSIIGLWIGIRGASTAKRTWAASLVSSAAAGLTTAVLVGAFVFVIGILDAADVEMRNYLVQLSRPSVQLLIFTKKPVVGSFLTAGIFIISSALGGLLSLAAEHQRHSQQWQAAFFERFSDLSLKRVKDTFHNNTRLRWVGYGLFLAISLLIPQFLSKYWNYAMGTVGIYVLMGLGLNIVVGLAGLLGLGYVAFFAIGAYTVGLLTAPAPISLQIGFWPALIASVVLAALTGILLGLPVLRMRGDYLAIVTLGFGEIIRVLIRSDLMSPYLGGPQGIRDIAGPTIFGVSLSSEKAYLYLIVIGILLAIFFTNHLQNSRVGRAWMAIREDETVAQAMGINTLYYKLLAFATGAAFAGVGGALFAARNQYTGPADHTLMVSINVLCLLIVGGMGSIPGVIVGAFVLKGFPEILRELELYRLLTFGGLLVVMMVLRPEGLWPAPRRRLELYTEDSSTSAPEDESAGQGAEKV